MPEPIFKFRIKNDIQINDWEDSYKLQIECSELQRCDQKCFEIALNTYLQKFNKDIETKLDASVPDRSKLFLSMKTWQLHGDGTFYIGVKRFKNAFWLEACYVPASSQITKYPILRGFSQRVGETNDVYTEMEVITPHVNPVL